MLIKRCPDILLNQLQIVEIWILGILICIVGISGIENKHIARTYRAPSYCQKTKAFVFLDKKNMGLHKY